MKNVDCEISILNESINKDIINNQIIKDNGHLSQSIIGKLRNFVEVVVVKFDSRYKEYSNNNFKTVKNHVFSNSKYKFLKTFHKCLQEVSSHYTQSEEDCERLILKYYDYLIKIKLLFKEKYNISILENIDKLQKNNNNICEEYYKKIVLEIDKLPNKRKKLNYDERYYIKKIKPFFINNKEYYEITFVIANDNLSKFNRVIAFTKLNILSNYSVKLSISSSEIYSFEKKMPILIIDDWEISIRKCELDNFAKIFGINDKIDSTSKEYNRLMLILKETNLNLVDILEFSDFYYNSFRNEILKDVKKSNILNVLDKVRKLLINNDSGSNIIKYLLYNLNNKIIKNQMSKYNCQKLSNLYLNFKCIPFEEMPFCSSLINHNPKIYDLFECFDIEGHEFELFARFIKNNTEKKRILYTPIEDLKDFETESNIYKFIKLHNNKLYSSHKPKRNLEIYKDCIYINSYEKEIIDIINKLRGIALCGIKNYSNSVNSWLKEEIKIDSDEKKNILKNLFENSKVALIYGAAGTGKTKMIEHISSFHDEYKKLYLTITNSAINNLKNRINIKNSSFQTVSKFLNSKNIDNECDLLIIDECSIVNNSDFLNILEKTKFKLLILVGDVHQLESINFGNWFNIIRYFLKESAVFELSEPYRTKNHNLLELWNKIRNNEYNILEHIVNNDYSKILDESFFKPLDNEDEIILCLNYDGLYGINNINNFLQANNNNKEIKWKVYNYKINDPILFNDSERFKPLLHNNLKGKIINIELLNDKIKFDIEINKSINELDISNYDGLNLLNESSNNKSIISFFVDKSSNSDEDNESLNTVIPFQVAYAISIHKSQGLEYNSVKVVIINEIEEIISHNIFYTSITRTKEKLKIYWTPETENKILENLKHNLNKKDIKLLKLRLDKNNKF